MQHLIVNSESQPLDNWQAAFPGAVVLKRPDLMRSTVAADLIWCRLNSGENVEDVIAPCLTLGQPVVVLADEPDETIVVAVLEAGAAGCCNSRAASEVLQQVAVVVGNGGLWVGQSILRRIVGGASRALGKRAAVPKEDSWTKKLSERECQVAKLVASGESNKEIADHLAISERTVKAHLTSVFEKLALRDRLQLSLRINGLPG